jgi:hypothetical protein
MARRFVAAVLLATCALPIADATGSGMRTGRLRRKAHAVYISDTSQSMKSQYPYYHTSDEITQEANDLQSRCNGKLTMQTVQGEGVAIDVATVKAPGTEPKNRMFVLFGDHARELISPETGIALLQTLCGVGDLSLLQTKTKAKSADDYLQDTEFQLVLNGNPNSRRKVEQGDYCLRVNENGVDLNRNWDEKWEAEAMDFANTNPGPRPFSESETKIFKQLVSDYNPTTFLTIHSGTRGMYMPWAYDMQHLATRNQPEMMAILKQVDQDHCECPFGAAGKEVGYPCPGTCLDWVYDRVETPYSFAFEIYTSPDKDESLKSRWQEKLASGGAALIQEGHHLGHSHFKDLFVEHPTDFVQTSMRTKQVFDCFGNFNPDTEERYHETVNNWVQAYLEVADMTATNLKNGAGSNTGNTTLPF